MRHTHIQNIFVRFLVVCLGISIVVLSTAQTQPAPTTIRLHTGTRAEINNLSEAHTWWNTTTGYLRDRNNEIRDLEMDLKILNYALSDAWDTRLNEVISGTGAGADLSAGSALASSLIVMRKNNQIWQIKRDRMRKYAEIASKQSSVNAYANDRDRVYTVFRAWWEYTYSGSNPVPEKSPSPKTVSVPSVLTLECENECGSSWRSSSADALITAATTYHKKTCNETPHKSYEYWDCDRDGVCDKESEHHVACVGGCGQMGQPEWGSIGTTGYTYGPSKGWGNNELVTIYSHLKRCSANVSRVSWRFGRCLGYYYGCNGQMDADCPNSDNHVSGNASQQACGHTYDPNSSAANNHRSISYACSTHTYYACQTPSTSSHAWVSSCSETENGNTCTNSSGYYACAPHSHSYPSSSPVYTPPSSPTPTPTPTPPSSTTVACGGASYTGCSGAPSRTAHHVPLCSNGCGNGYWTCSASAVRNHETSYTCRRCGTSFTRCSNGACSSGYAYHWAR